MKTKRIEEIGILNCFLCLLVMLIHVSSSIIGKAHPESLQYLLLTTAMRCSAFVVQGFVFLSAFKLFCKEEQSTYVSFMKGKLKNIYLPYCLWNLIYYINFCLAGYFPFSVKDYLTYCLNGTLSAPFYFVVFIMQFYWLRPLWTVVYQRCPPWLTLLVSAFFTLSDSSFIGKVFPFLLPYYDRIFTTYLLYWTLGAYCGKYHQVFFDSLNKYKFVTVGGFVVMLAMNVTTFYKAQVLGIYSPHVHLILQFYCVASIFFGLYLTTKLKHTVIRHICVIEKLTFTMYLSHCFFLFYVQKISETMVFPSLAVEYILHIVALYSSTIFFNWSYFKCKSLLLAKK